MITQLSILIPTYNDYCYSLVNNLYTLARREKMLCSFEIIVGDDGSTDKNCIEKNKKIANLPNCFYLQQPKNQGRSAIRNYLISQSKYPWLLFIDADMSVVSDNYLSNYLKQDADIVDGGYSIVGHYQHHLRFLYELSTTDNRKAVNRNRSAYQQFHSSNFLAKRSVMQSYPFDERFKYYGYEDVLLGKVFQEHNVTVLHIDNPVGFNQFESNSKCVDKTEEALRTLHQFESELSGYSNLLGIVKYLNQLHLAWILKGLFRLFNKQLHENLCGNKPNLTIFKLYKLGYYLSL